MSQCESRPKTVKKIKVGENTLEPEVILMENEDFKVSGQALQLIGKNMLLLLETENLMWERFYGIRLEQCR
jgi:hypothetical protein